MKGAIIGDIIGAPFEFNRTKNDNFKYREEKEKYTDDTVLTIATMKAILNNTTYEEETIKITNEYQNKGYGLRFQNWIAGEKKPYNSFGNGSGVSPIGLYFNTIEEVMEEAKKSAEFTHNHPEGIKGAQVTAIAIFMAKKGASKQDIKKYIEDIFKYDLNRQIKDFKDTYQFNEICQTTVPEAIICFLESNNYEDTIRKAISLGGDTDTLACIAGGIAEAYYKEIPSHLLNRLNILPKDFIETIKRFYKKI
jgi:ADP-ribosylglycohydrolase